MAVIGALSVCPEAPRLEDRVTFYTDAGLKLSDAGEQAQAVLLRADKLDEIAERVPPLGGEGFAAPEGFVHDDELHPHGPAHQALEREPA